MPFDRKFDPETGDFIRDGKGSYERTPYADTSVMNQVLAKRGAWWGDPDLGILEDGLRELDPSNPARDAEQALKRGLGRLEEMGRIDSLEVKASEPAPGRLRVDTKFRDRSTNSVVSARVKSGG